MTPQIVHTIAQPTNNSLLLTRLLRQYWPHARSVVSALSADQYFPAAAIQRKHRLLMPLCRPDLVLVQSAHAAGLFAQLGCRVRFLPNGVDLKRFKPVGPDEKRMLRGKYGLDPDRPVVLHVGHLIPNRNLTALERLPGAGIQVLVAGSLYMGTHDDLIARLERSGYHVRKGYQPQVEELYALSDLYVFPLRPGNSLTTPLSILEAMACNLPVLATRFAGLEHAFPAGQGLQYIDDADDLLLPIQRALTLLSSGGLQVNTREMVQGYSWASIADQLHAYYKEIAQC
jgi:glycosyltransferase involved in cell wall biosynthesis